MKFGQQAKAEDYEEDIKSTTSIREILQNLLTTLVLGPSRQTSEGNGTRCQPGLQVGLGSEK